jgi:alkanesulfonate monooxygenase SsuD/methylene tetrahydromethanopterin reductase-like flavin-dependent oxidoreductase (luciferase family)
VQVYQFSEQPYHVAWDIAKEVDSLRVTLPNRLCEPEVASRLINERLDEWALCDELGLNIIVNEHHASATSVSPSPTVTLAMLARETKHARLLACGYPLANRTEPIRLAEELAYIDVVSKGRVDIGLVKGSPYDVAPANSNPVGITERFWDTHDLIVEALTRQDGPFTWESPFHEYRQVNIWPRPWQQPRPPIFVTGGSVETARAVGRRGHTLITILGGWNAIKVFDAYRESATEAGITPGPSNFGYCALIGVGETEAQGLERLDRIAGYFRTTSIVAEPFVNPPGYMSAEGNAAWKRKNQTRGRAGKHFPATTRDGRQLKIGSGAGHGIGVTPRDMIEAAIAFGGTPEQVAAQIAELNEHLGGFGTLIMMGHGGDLSHEETKESLTLFGREVLPRIQSLNATAGAVR